MKNRILLLAVIFTLLSNCFLMAALQFENIVPEASHAELSDDQTEILSKDSSAEKADSEVSLIEKNDKSTNELWENIKKFVSSIFNPAYHDKQDIEAVKIKSSGKRTPKKSSSIKTPVVSRNRSKNSKEVTELNSIKARILHKYGVKLTEKGSTWNKMQLKILEQTFSLLPASFVKQTTNISREPLPPPGKSPLIAAYIYKGSTKVHLLDWGSQMSPQYLEDFKKAYRRPPNENDLYRALVDKIPGTLAHEMTHCFQSKNPAIMAAWKKKFNFRDSPTLYGKTNDREDMAESVKLFFLGGKLSGNKFIAKTGEKMDLDRYNFIKNNIMSGKEFIGSNIPKFF